MAVGTPHVGTQLEGTSGGTSAVPYPTTVNANDFLCLVMSTNSATLTTLPSGWTSVFSQANTTNALPNIFLAYKFAAGSEGGTTITVTHASGVSISQILGFPGVDLTTPLDIAVTSVDSSVNTTTPTLPGGTITTAGSAMLYAVAGPGTSATATPPSGFTETMDRSTGTRAATAGYETGLSTGATGNQVVTFTGTGKPIGVLMFIRAASVSFSGTLATSGDGTTTFVFIPAFTDVLTTSGSGTASFVQTSITVSGTLATSGSGTASFVQTAMTVSGTLGTSGSGTASFGAAPGFAAPLTTSGSGTATFAGSPGFAASLTTSGSGTATFSATLAVATTLATSGSGTATFVSALMGALGTLGTSGSGTATFSGQGTSADALNTTGTGTASFAGTPHFTTSLGFSGSGTATFSTVVGFAFGPTFSGSGTATFGSLVGFAAALTTSGSGTNVFVGLPMQASPLSTSGSGTTNFSGVPTINSSATFSGLGVLAFLSAVGLLGSLATSGDGTNTFDGVAFFAGNLNTSGSGSNRFVVVFLPSNVTMGGSLSPKVWNGQVISKQDSGFGWKGVLL